jgi:hypothetical protein
VAGQPTGHAQQVHQSVAGGFALNQFQHNSLASLRSAWRRLHRIVRRRVSSRASRLRPARQWLLSIVFAALFGGLGWSALPANVTRASSALSLRDPLAGNATIATPVFVLRDSGVAVRFGNAITQSGGVIRVGFYDPLDPLLIRATEPVSLPSDARLLWLLASATERQSLRDHTADLAVAMSHAAFDVFRSPEFRIDYRDRLVQLLRVDLQRAWQVTQQNGAWDELLHGYEPILRETASRDLRPIIESHFRGVPMRMLKANALEIVNPFGSDNWNMAPVEDALQQAVQEIRDRGIPERTASRLIDAPPTADFLRVFLDAMGAQLAGDTALKDLLGQMVFDERFRPYLDGVTAQAMALGRVAPRLLVSLHGSTDLNSVAAAVIRTMITGEPDRVVVFMSPRQRDELLALDPNAPHMLQRAGS